MSFLLYVLGAAMAAAGILMIGFGIPINEFSLGNTLIISGTTAVAGGVVVIGLAVVARQVKALAEADVAMPRGPRSSDQGDPRGGPPRPQGAPRPGGPRFSAPDEEEFMPEAPAAPPPPPAPASRPAAAPSFETRDETPPRGPRIPGLGAPRAPEPAPPRREPSPAPARAADSFDSAWPDTSRSDRAPFGSAPRVNGEAAPPKGGDRGGPVTILKSGVVDGMAYTLYTDGSIEAELAQGVVRFGSIEELRNHLEKNA